MKLTQLAALFSAALAANAFATDVFYPDKTATSSNKRYKVEAKSPDNKGGLRRAFQKDFAYTLTDLNTKRVIWRRQQIKDEGSCASLHVNDEGTVVLYTGWNYLIVINQAGHDVGRVNILKEGLKEAERKRYVHNTTAGPLWAGYSLWYFPATRTNRLFVIRPWWDKRLLLNLRTGSFISEDRDTANACFAAERQWVLQELTKATSLKKDWDKGERYKNVAAALKATYLASELNLKESVPLIRQLEDSAFIGRATVGGLSALEKFDGEIDPTSYTTFTLRQVTQLSLRRLGEVTRQLPVHQFKIRYKNYKKDRAFESPALASPRHMSADQVKIGMRAEQVLAIVGSPDFVGRDTWEYDMDSKPPFSLILSWDARRVGSVERKAPPLWQIPEARDLQIVY